MFAKIDISALVGQRFGALTVLGEGPKIRKYGRALGRSIVVECECGNHKTYLAAYFRYREPQSCGCKHAELIGNSLRKHGKRDSATYAVWAAMRARCSNPKQESYPIYGGRGIRVCERWQSFENFLEDMGERPTEDRSLDRIDADGHYEPGNCRWATIDVQQNNRRNNVRIEIDGREQTAAQWAREIGVDPRVIYSRMKRGWSGQRAVLEGKP